jgi:hypothetical protein
MTSKNEVFDTITVRSIAFENPPVNTFDPSTAGTYPSQNSIMTVIDNVGTAQFSRNITCDSVSVQNLNATIGAFTSLTTTNSTFGSLTVSTPFTVEGNIEVTGNGITTGIVRAPALRIGTGILDVSGNGNPRWTNGPAIDLAGWVPKLAQNTSIALLNPDTATPEQIATTLNQLLSALKGNGVFIS